MPKSKKSLVVDASIARAAGTTDHPTSIHCRDFLDAFQEQTLWIVMSAEIRAEWIEHRSRFTKRWLRMMTGRKRVTEVGDVRNDILRKRIRSTSSHVNQQDAMEKDCLLLEAALAGDEVVFSLDEKIRGHFRNAAASVHEIKSIHWANPDLSEDTAVTWLKDGAPADKTRQLGYVGG